MSTRLAQLESLVYRQTDSRDSFAARYATVNGKLALLYAPQKYLATKEGIVTDQVRGYLLLADSVEKVDPAVGADAELTQLPRCH
ncbi:hypothetical protein [Pseudomonas sp. Ant30-3]|uniref:hypothetical protein n=1 Tax=Pseudomonas sp. Ant30-3 TaxID=1488328 RepID=UPI000A40CB8D|nr:hypothetical protein [Pseudomonas sp. Ant30-3]